MRRAPITLISLSLCLLFSLSGCPGEGPTVWPENDGAAASDRGRKDTKGAGKQDQGKLPKQDKGIKPKQDKGPTPKQDKGTTSKITPALNGSSGGKGGAASPGGSTKSAGGVSYILIAPSSYTSSTPHPLLLVFSGTEGYQMMAQNLKSVGGYLGLGGFIFAVLDGKATFGNGQAGATVLDQVRQQYNIDNDRTYLLSESAGTKAGLQIGLQLRQSYFAAYWANDVNASAQPSKTAAQLGFKPWGNAGPGGQYTTANAIVSGMKAAGYRLPSQAPYSGSGAGQHGSTQQFMAAVQFFKGKSRK